ncbi:MAG: hypothetical protein CM1200mP41_29130 [Gammaproteobacteria bacterium]|nr:MAG: hypothetical protein CM1200mP41_29130 [Gammaproteobacteria bacterium]
MTKTALVTGITGQDGAYLGETLLGKGIFVQVLNDERLRSTPQRIDHLYQDPHELDPRLILHHGDLTAHV